MEKVIFFPYLLTVVLKCQQVLIKLHMKEHYRIVLRIDKNRN